MDQQKKLDRFIKKATLKYGDKFDYSKIQYGCNNKDRVTITCHTHGDFKQSPHRHLESVFGCAKCARVLGGDIATRGDKFIKKSLELYGDIYDYSKTQYRGSKEWVTITCKKHGDFTIEARSHIKKTNCGGCPKCSKELIRANTLPTLTANFISKARKVHGDRYDYSKVYYFNAHTHVTIICKEHGEFEQLPLSHTNQHSGCPTCAGGGSLSSAKVFIEKARKEHGNKFDYSKVDYVHSKKKVTIVCPIHGVFKQQPKNHLQSKCGCYKCGYLSQSITITNR